MDYWAYENWRAHGHVTKVHRHDCAHCNDGRGQQGGTRADNGRWLHLGVCRSPDEAIEKARRLVDGGVVRCCGVCLRQL